ncbi:MAG: FmdB family transcriptional regulator [Chloroflexi bacterium]|nr:FmdB family transcriptional regulator [Chloroflexota bacterium]|tara:strand:+ start:25587 stop:25928 length:342 start_codon:yes stop_codon:yes gene_type:complete
MPKYDYKCNNEKCEEIFEVTQSFSDEPIANCIVCGSSSKRLISKVAVHFKGSGWYSTENRSKSTSENSQKNKKDSNKNTKTKEKTSNSKKDNSKKTSHKPSIKKTSNSANKNK